MKQQKIDAWEMMSFETFSGSIWPLSLLQIFLDSETRAKLDDIEPNLSNRACHGINDRVLLSTDDSYVIMSIVI